MIFSSGFTLDSVSVSLPYLTRSDFNLKGSLIRLALGKERKIRRVLALDNVSVSFGLGERVGIVGRNGAGKTTLLRVLAGHIPVDRGFIARPKNVRALIGDAGLGIDLEESGLENLARLLLINGTPRSDVRDVIRKSLELLDLGEALWRPCYTYSSGMLTRIRVVSLLQVRPDALLLDELLGQADSTFNARVRVHLEAVFDKCPIRILASHDENLIRRMCSRVLYFDAGRLVMDGGTDEVLARYAFERVSQHPEIYPDSEIKNFHN